VEHDTVLNSECKGLEYSSHKFFEKSVSRQEPIRVEHHIVLNLECERLVSNINFIKAF
jgi:hypothetical protein